MTDLDTQLRQYFEAIAPPFEVGDLVRDGDTNVVPLTAGQTHRRRPWLGVAAAIITLVVVGGLPWLLRDKGTEPSPATTTGVLEVEEDMVLGADHVGIVLVTEDGVTLDCDGHEIRGAGPGTDSQIAIEIAERTDVTVRNCVIVGFGYGISVIASVRVTVADNTVDTTFGGVGAADSSEIEITGNTVRGVQVDGFLFQNMADSTVRGNTATDNLKNFSFELGATRNIVEANTARGGETGFEIGDATGNVFRRNTAVDAAVWGIEDSSGGEAGPVQNEYDNNRCDGPASTPPDLCSP